MSLELLRGVHPRTSTPAGHRRAHRITVAATSALALLAFFGGGCSGGGGGGSSAPATLVGRFAIVVTSDAAVVHELPSLHPLNYIPLAGLARGAALDPAGRHVLVAVDDGGIPLLEVFAIDDVGTLEPVTGSPFASPAGADIPLLVHPEGEHVFVGGSGIHVLEFDADTGALAPAAGSPFAAATFPTSFATDPAGTRLFTGEAGFDLLHVHAIDPVDGSLDELPGSPYVVGDQPSAIAVHPNGRFVYVANAVSDDVSGFAIASDGALSPLAGFPLPGGNGPLDITFDPSGSFLFTADESGASISSFAVDPLSGALTPAAAGVQFVGSLPNGVAADPDGASVYAIASGGHELVSFSIETNGDLSRTASARSRRTPIDLLVVPAAERTRRVPTFAFAASRLSAQIEAFTIDPSDGRLTELASSPTPMTAQSNALVLDVRARFLFAGHDGGGIDVFTVAVDGDLTLVAGSPFAPMVGVGTMTCEVSGRFLFASSNDLVHGYSIDPSSGALTALPGSPFDFATGGIIMGLTVDPSGRVLHVLTSGLVVAGAIDVETGVPVPVAASSFAFNAARELGLLGSGRFAYLPSTTQAELARVPAAAPTGVLQGTLAVTVPTDPMPFDIAVHPTDRWLFLPHPGAGVGAVGVFSVDRSNGVQVEIPASPFSDGASPIGLRVDPSGSWLYALNQNAAPTYFEIDAESGALLPLGTAESGLFDPLDLVIAGRIE